MKNKISSKLQLNGIIISILLVFILSLTPLISINICTPNESEAADLTKILDAARNCEEGLSEDEYLNLTQLFIENTESSKVNINLIGIVGNAAGIFETAKTWITVNSIEKTMNSIVQKLESDPSYADSAAHTRNVEKLNSLNDTLGNINASLID